jgi:hypothetical protein
MLALHLDNLLFLLLIGMAALLRLLASKAGDAKKKSREPEQTSTMAPRPTQPIARAPAESDAERIRKFLEALGQPASSEPPPPIEPRRPTYEKPIVVSHVPPFASPLPPLTTRPPDLPRERRLPRQITETPQQAKPLKREIAAAPVFEIQKQQTQTEAPPAIKTPAEAYAIASQPKSDSGQTEISVAVLLRSPSGLRNAIILREIFGPPRSLQPLELVGQNL